MEIPQNKEKKTENSNQSSDSSYVTDSSTCENEGFEKRKVEDGSLTSDDEYREEFSKIIREKVNNKLSKLIKRDISIRPSKTSEVLLKNLAKTEGLKKRTQVDSLKVPNSKNIPPKVNKSSKLKESNYEKVDKNAKRRVKVTNKVLETKKKEKSPENVRVPPLASTSKKTTKKSPEKSPSRIVVDKKKKIQKQKSGKKKTGGKIKIKAKKVQPKRVSFFPEVIEIQSDQYDGGSESDSTESDSREESSSSLASIQDNNIINTLEAMTPERAQKIKNFYKKWATKPKDENLKQEKCFLEMKGLRMSHPLNKII